MSNKLYYGDNLEVMRKYIKDESIDLCYIDPPFNSKRNYNQIYNNIGSEDRAQAEAFTDTWIWDEIASLGFQEIISNNKGIFQSRTIDLISAFKDILGQGSLLAYLVSMTLRINEIHRVLKSNGSFYLHCDPTASHYLKLVIDSIFIPTGGDFRNEIVWYYKTGGTSKRWFSRKHDIIFFYTKSKEYTFNQLREKSYLSHKYGFKNVEILEDGNGNYTMVGMRDVWDIAALRGNQPETLGYPTQKPETLLERIISASSNEGDVVLDAYCGCGTTVSVAQRLKRKWIGIDITYQAISLILARLENQYSVKVLDDVILDGIPKDMKSAEALANKEDDRTRKEFEKWAVLTYSKNRAMINTKKGADKGIDGIAHFQTSRDKTAKIIFQVKSGNVSRKDIATLSGDMTREGAALGIFITLKEPTAPMIQEAKTLGHYTSELMGKDYEKIQIISVRDIIEDHKRLDMPMSFEVIKKAQKVEVENQDRLI